MSDQWFYANNQVQEGPISFEELKALAAAGTLDPEHSLVWKDGYEDWVAAGSVEGLFPAGQEIEKVASGEVPEAAPFGGELTIKGCVKEAWRLTREHWAKVLGLIVVYALIYGAFAFVSRLSQDASGVERDADGFVVSGFGILLLFLVLETLFGIFLGLGMTKFFLNLMSDSSEAKISDLFSQGGKLISALVAYIIYILLVILGTILFVIPGIIFATRLFFYQIAIVDKGLGPIDALQYSWDITRGHVIKLNVLASVAFLIVIGGMLAFMIGLIWAIPCATFMYFLTYRILQGRKVDAEVSA